MPPTLVSKSQRLIRLVPQCKSWGEFTLMAADLPAVIGRHSDANICIRHSWVSRFHCLLERKGDRIWIRDLESANGTFLNGEPITAAFLKDGDSLQVGLTAFDVTFEEVLADS